MQINCKYEKLVPATTLVQHEMNANKHPARQIEMLAKILKYQGWRHPIVVSKLSGKIVAGHGRLEAAKANGWDEVPVDMQDFDDKAQELSFLASDNKIQELAETDDDAMIALIKATDIDDLELFGLDDFELPKDDAEAREEIEDEVPEVTESISKLGDVYYLGDHTLVCGDSTDPCAVDLLMNGEKADMVFTDPPYGMGLDTDYSKTMNVGGKSKMSDTHFAKTHKPVIGDDKDFDPSDIIPMAKEVFLWGADYYCKHIPNSGSWLVWDKTGSESMDKMYGSNFELCWSKNKHKREIARITWSGFLGVKDDAKNRVHPTQKPTQLIEWVFDKWCGGLNSVLDLFGGSGSTLIACEKTNRKCFMMELDPHYIDVIVTRWCKYTNNVNIKRNGEPMEWTLGRDQ